MKYVYIWEHDFENFLKQNRDAYDYVHSLNLQERLDTQKSFFGGRTNAVKMYYQVKESEKITILIVALFTPRSTSMADIP